MGFIHPKALVNNTKLGKNCWVSAFAAINGDEGAIEIGSNCSVQESCVLHGKGVKIGDNVTIGHGAIVHGSRVGNNVLIGMNSTILSGARIGDWSIIGAGALVLENAVIPKRSVVLGVPGKILKRVGAPEKLLITQSIENYLLKLKEKKLLEK